MDHLLYTSMTGARENMFKQAAHANNLANVSTTGFYRDFAQARSMPVFGDGFPTRAVAMTERPATDFANGAMNETGQPLDAAIQGQGFFAVQSQDGSEAYTRAGDFSVDVNGILRTGTGLPVLGDGGPIALPPVSSMTIGTDGSISIVPLGQAPESVATIERIKLVKPEIDQVEKGRDGLFRLKGGLPAEPDASVRIATGFLETSNVNAVEEMTEVLMMARQFEMQVKMMSKAEEMDGHSARLLQNVA